MLRATAWRAWRLPRPLLPAAARGGRRQGSRPCSAVTNWRFTSTLSGRGSDPSDRNPPSRVVNNARNLTREMSKSEAKLLTTLRTYKEKYGDLLVTCTFTVPSSESSWPSVMWGYKLGVAVSQLRYKLEHESHKVPAEMKQELDDMDFVRGVSQYHWDHIFLPSLRRFHELSGHTDVPNSFIVPIGDEAWPKLAWGKALGRVARHVRGGTAYAARIAQSGEELERLQFCYKTTVAERDWTQKILPSLEVYRQKFGHCIVRQDFVVPSSAPWPGKAWKMALGVAINDIRLGKSYVEQVARDKDLLDGLGFAWNRDAAVWSEEIIPALQVFAEVYKGRHVPAKFVVPSESPWPNRVWGMRLGSKLCDLRCKGAYFAYYGRDFETLEGLGVNMKLSARAWRSRVVPLLEMYAMLYGDHEVPDNFVIPSKAPWPEKMWGVRLGLIVARNSQHVQRG